MKKPTAFVWICIFACLVLTSCQKETRKTNQRLSPTYGNRGVITSDNALYVWNWNFSFHQGANADNTIIISSPEKLMDDVAFIWEHDNALSIIKQDNSLWFWGYDYYNYIPSGLPESDFIYLLADIDFYPEPIKIMEDVVYVTGQLYQDFSLLNNIDIKMAIQSDGSLWIWGNHYKAKKENGADLGYRQPTKVLDDVIDVSCFYRTVMALQKDKQLVAWNLDFESFANEIFLETPPTAIGEHMVAIDNYARFHALEDNGNLWEIKSTADSAEGRPALLEKIAGDVIQVSSHYESTMILKKDHTMWQINPYNKTPPLQIAAEVSEIFSLGYADDSHGTSTYYRKEDNSLWKVESGYVDDNTISFQNEKIIDDIAFIGGVEDKKQILIRTDGSLWHLFASKDIGASLGFSEEDYTNNPNLVIPILEDVIIPRSQIKLSKNKLPMELAQQPIIRYNEKPISTYMPIIMKDNRMFASFADLTQALGGEMVYLEEDGARVSILNDHSIYFNSQSNEYYVDQIEQIMDTQSFYLFETLYVPIRYTVEAWDLDITYDEKINTIYLR